MSLTSAMKVTGLTLDQARLLGLIQIRRAPIHEQWMWHGLTYAAWFDGFEARGLIRRDGVTGHPALTDTGQAVLDEWRQEVSR